MSKQFYFKLFSLEWVHGLVIKKLPLQAIHFSISMQFIPIWPIDRALPGATTLGQSRPGSDGNERALHIPQNSSIIETSPSDYLVLYPEHSLVGGLTLLQSCSQCILQPQPARQYVGEVFVAK